MSKNNPKAASLRDAELRAALAHTVWGPLLPHMGRISLLAAHRCFAGYDGEVTLFGSASMEELAEDLAPMSPEFPKYTPRVMRQYYKVGRKVCKDLQAALEKAGVRPALVVPETELRALVDACRSGEPRAKAGEILRLARALVAASA